MDKLLRADLQFFVDISDYFVLNKLVWEDSESNIKDTSLFLMRGELSKEYPLIPKDGGIVG